MGTLTANMFVTLDGVVQAPGQPDEDREGGFVHGGWQVPFFDDESGQAIMQGIDAMDAMLLGRKTYDIFAGYWPHAPADNPVAPKFNAMPKYVASRTQKEAAWNNTSILAGELAEQVQTIKDEHDDIGTWGSADLLQSLLHHGLVDRLTLYVYPIVLGTGKRLFADGVDPARFNLIESRAFPNGAVMMHLRPAGKPTYGTTALDDPRAQAEAAREAV